MRHARMLILPIALTLCSTSTSALAASENHGSDNAPGVLRLAVPLIDAPSRMTAIGLSTLAESRPSGFKIDTAWIGSGDDALERLALRDADLALVQLDESGREGLKGRPDLRAVMKYWTSNDAAADDSKQEAPEQLLVANASLPPERVEDLLEVALQDHVVLRAARVDVARLTPEEALTGLPIAAHDGVVSYLRRQDVTPPPRPALRPVGAGGAAADGTAAPKPGYSRADIRAARLDLQEKDTSSKSFILYFETGDAAVDRDGFKSVAEACNYAAGLSRARFVISGHTDTVGTDADNDALSSRRAGAVADAIRNDPRFRESLSVVEFGEQHLAVVTGDEVNEPMNRRVEITVLEGQ